MSGSVNGAVGGILRGEGAAALLASVLAYHALGGGWLLFAVLFLAPDLSMLGYLVNPRLGLPATMSAIAISPRPCSA